MRFQSFDVQGAFEAEECAHHKKAMPENGGRRFDPDAFQGPMQSVNADRAKSRYKASHSDATQQFSHSAETNVVVDVLI